MSEGVRIGSLVHTDHRADVLRMLEEGLAQGGTVVTGGVAVEGDGAFMQPTVVTDVDSSNLLFQEELFGPVLAVTKFTEEAEALALANDTPFGLLNGVWTNDLSRAHRFARDLQSGMVSYQRVSNHLPTDSLHWLEAIRNWYRAEPRCSSLLHSSQERQRQTLR
jgi:aldehyde dehydrogenase (NAD+)